MKKANKKHLKSFKNSLPELNDEIFNPDNNLYNNPYVNDCLDFPVIKSNNRNDSKKDEKERYDEI